MRKNRMYNDYFESFLKEAVDNFNMQPSKRVWTGIYNNVHPGRAYPSFSTTVIIITLLIFAGFNGKRLSDSDFKTENKNNSASASIKKTNITAVGDISFAEIKTSSVLNLNQKKYGDNTILAFTKLHSTTNEGCNKTTVNTNQNKALSTGVDDNNINNSKVEIPTTTGLEMNSEKKIGNLKNEPLAVEEANINMPDEKQWIENFAFANLKSGKYKKQVNIEFYAAPSLGFRNMNRTTDKVINIPSLVAQINQNENYSLRHLPGINLEAGGSVSFGVNKMLRLKAGMQFNFSGYQIVANNVNQTVGSYLQMKQYSNGLGAIIFRNSHIENVPADQQGEKLQNTSYQISIPLGTEFILAENGSFEWSAGATVQPSYIIGGEPYLISADMKNYIDDPTLMRKWNVNAGIETFLSYKLKNGSMLNAGPQFRYQLLSSYDSKYIYNEKLYNLGVKFGITTKL